MKVKEFNKFIDRLELGNPTTPPSKEELYQLIFADMVNRTSQMFEYSGLPDSIPQRNLELYLQLYGYTVIDKVNDTLYAFKCGLGGEPDVYYQPTLATIANPALHYSATRTLHTDVALIRSDSLMQGIGGINNQYAWYLTEAYLTLRLALINARSEYIINSPDDNSEKGAEAFLRSIINGELSFTKTVGFDEKLSLQTLPYSQNAMSAIKSAIEAIQYLTGCWYRKIGLTSAYNMKREYVSEGELEDDSVDSLIFDMLECRKKGIEEVNKLFNTNISVRLGKGWNAEPKEQAEIKEPKEDTPDESQRTL